MLFYLLSLLLSISWRYILYMYYNQIAENVCSFGILSEFFWEIQLIPKGTGKKPPRSAEIQLFFLEINGKENKIPLVHEYPVCVCTIV